MFIWFKLDMNLSQEEYLLSKKIEKKKKNIVKLIFKYE